MSLLRVVILSFMLIMVAVLFATPATPENMTSLIVGSVCGAALALVIRKLHGHH